MFWTVGSLGLRISVLDPPGIKTQFSWRRETGSGVMDLCERVGSWPQRQVDINLLLDKICLGGGFKYLLVSPRTLGT